MSITFPLTPPSTPAPNGVKLTGKSTVGVATSPFTGQSQVLEWPAEGFVLDVSLPPMVRANAEQWIAFLLSLRGASGTFHYGDPAATTPRGVATGTPLVNGANAAGSKTLVTKGWTHSITGILLAGDYVQVGTGDTQRIHKVLKDVNSDGSGNATLDIFPRLREALADAAAITVNSCAGTFRLTSNAQQFDIDVAKVYGISFQAAEAL